MNRRGAIAYTAADFVAGHPPLMPRTAFVAALILFSLGTTEAVATDCAGSAVPLPLPVRPTAIPPVAHELPGTGSQLGEPRGLLARYSDESQSVDRVLMRSRLKACRQAAAADPGAGYTPRTEFDNTPYRFNARKGFTAAEFEAWMKEKGIRIVNGRAVIGGAPQPAEAAAQPAAATATTQCAQGAASAC
ncbi:hypothetical protein [Rehaibacterium terrae]|uniref:Uncharacterized protein n=1 Tax=Rehaibacterium terrae TaxID=1341696 RepID=A0A7W7Y0H2_9GAMM|nr:hypothetical protein [Rehaibacterium terrae]MBB5015833.1 hypothetical protein [Rehaibacterium terrae]